MPMQTVTKPIMLDETGLLIVDALSGLTDAVKPDAVNIPYDNTDSGLEAETVQGAIDENAGAISELNSSLSNHEVITSGMQVPIRIAQAGNLISLTLGSAITRTWGAYETYNIGTVPVKYRPPIDVCVPCVISDRSMIFRMYIKSTGTLDIYNPGGAISSNISVISGNTITYSIV